MQPCRQAPSRSRGNAAAVLLVIVAVLFAGGVLAWLVLRRTPAENARDGASFIPADAAMVLTVHLPRLLEKSALPLLIQERIDQLPGARMFINPARLKDDADLAAKGLRTDAPWHFFIKPDEAGKPVYGLVIPLRDRRAFEQGLRDLPAQLGMQFLNRVQTRGSLHGIFDGREPFAAAYDESTLILLAQEGGAASLPSQLSQMFLKNPALDAPAFTALQASSADVAAWVKVEAAAKWLPADAEPLKALLREPRLSGLSQGQVTASVHFDAGRVRLDAALHTSAGTALLPLKPVDAGLVGLLPRDAIVAGVVGLNLEALTPLLSSVDEKSAALRQVVENFLGLSLAELRAQWQGDLALALTDVAPPEAKPAPGGTNERPALPWLKLPNLSLPKLPMPKVEFLAAASFAKPEQARSMASRLAPFEGLGMGALALDNRLILATSSHRESLKRERPAGPPLPAREWESFAGSSAALKIDLRRLGQAMLRFDEKAPDLDALGHLTLSLRQDAGQVRLQTHLELAEGGKNSLRKLLEMALDGLAPRRPGN